MGCLVRSLVFQQSPLGKARVNAHGCPSRLDLQRNEGEDDGEKDQDGRCGVDFGRDREAHHRIDLDREGDRVRTAGEKGDDKIVEAEREGEQRAGDQCWLDVRQQDIAKGLPLGRAQVLGRFLLLLVETRQPRAHDHRYERESRR